MLDSELQELERRRDLGDRITEIEKELGTEHSDDESKDPEHTSNFAGVWQDQMDGGAIVVALVNPQNEDTKKIEAIAGGPDNVRFVRQDHSWDEIESFRDTLLRSFRAKEVEAEVRINSTRSGRRLEIISPNPSDVSEDVLEGVPRDLLTVTEGPLDTEDSAPGNAHSESAQEPALKIEIDPGGWCMWGINGHTSNYNYLVTAGHCGDTSFENFTGWTSDFDIHQANSFELTPGSVYVRSVHGAVYDVKRVSSPQADSNRYHWQSYVSHRTLHNSWEIGADLVCAGLGSTGQYHCGYVLEENYTSSGSGCNQSRLVRYDIDTSGGDSGVGLIGDAPGDGQTIDAIHVCGSGSEGLGHTAYDVKKQLNFDFNCASYERTTTASNWGSCPTVNR